LGLALRRRSCLAAEWRFAGQERPWPDAAGHRRPVRQLRPCKVYAREWRDRSARPELRQVEPDGHCRLLQRLRRGSGHPRLARREGPQSDNDPSGRGRRRRRAGENFPRAGLCVAEAVQGWTPAGGMRPSNPLGGTQRARGCNQSASGCGRKSGSTAASISHNPCTCANLFYCMNID
jgi:hypothetical protein